MNGRQNGLQKQENLRAGLSLGERETVQEEVTNSLG